MSLIIKLETIWKNKVVLEKLKVVENRFAELGELLIQPDIISDQKKYIQLSKEYKEIKKIIDKGKFYKNLIANRLL